MLSSVGANSFCRSSHLKFSKTLSDVLQSTELTLAEHIFFISSLILFLSFSACKVTRGKSANGVNRWHEKTCTKLFILASYLRLAPRTNLGAILYYLFIACYFAI